MDFSTIIAFIFSGIVLLLCTWLILSRQKVLAKNVGLQDKLVVLEAKLMSPKQQSPSFTSSLEKKSQQPKSHDAQPHSNHSAEILNLRKETAKLKDEIKKAKEEIRLKDKALKEEENITKNKLYSLTEENARLIGQMRELDLLLKQNNNNVKKQVPLVDFEKKILEISQLKDEISNMKIKLSEHDKIKKQNLSKLNTVQEKLKSTEYELHKWLDTSKVNDGKPIDPSTFLRWHDRAVSGRKMYKLMRQMRELSDSKVTTYQEGVVALSEWVLKQKNINLPDVSSSEVLADRLLAEAWNAILPSHHVSE
jgi:hypothetical protein